LDSCVQDGDKRGLKHLAAASDALLGFRSDHPPVFWRVLIAQARLYQAPLRTSPTRRGPDAPGDRRHGWRSRSGGDSTDRAAVGQAGGVRFSRALRELAPADVER
jgi:hypothetical protein